MSCENCKSKSEDKKEKITLKDEIHSAVLERTIKRLFILLIISIIAIFASNACWLCAWCQYDYESSEIVTVDGQDGTANYIGSNGGIYNGGNYGQESPQEDTQE